MDGMQELDAYCASCAEPTKHYVADPGSCVCRTCGAGQLLVAPVSFEAVV